MSDDNPATDPEVKPPSPDPSEAPTQPITTPNKEMPEPEPVVIEEQKPESWISKHQQELEDYLNERDKKKTGPARPGKKDSIDDEPEPEPAPAPKRKKRVKLRSLKRSS